MMKKFILPFFLLIISLQGYTGILMTPWLQSVSTTSVFVLVECSSKDSVTISYGFTTSYGMEARSTIIATTTAQPATFVHKIRLNGLTPNSIYYYQAKQGTSVVPGAKFHTAVEPGTPFRFGWLADFRTGVKVHDTIDQLYKSWNPLFSLYGSDLCMNGSYTLWKEEFFRPDELKVISEIPFFNATGNHEGNGTNTRAFLRNPVSASKTQDYYSFDYGDLHVLCLNSEVSLDKDSPQYTFAAADLAGCNKPWKIVISHSPAYCSGGHGEDEKMIALTKNVLEPNHVTMVLSGHSHFYQHNLVNGIHHIIIGSAGAPLYAPRKAKYTLVSAKEYNYAIFDVTPGSLSMTVYNEKNRKLDTLHLEK